MRHLLAVLMCLAVSAAIAVAAPIPKELKGKVTLDGAWVMTETNYNGQTNAVPNPSTWTIDGTTMTIEQNFGRGGRAVNFAGGMPQYQLLRPDGEGKNALDWVMTFNGRETKYRGFVELQADTFRFCFVYDPAKERPKDVTPGEGRYLYTFKRPDAAEVAGK